MTATGTRDIATDFSLNSNPTADGWQYCESLANGAQLLTNVVRSRVKNDNASQIDRAWQLALGRLPTIEERNEAALLLDTLSATDPQTSWSMLCLALFNMQEFVYVD